MNRESDKMFKMIKQMIEEKGLTSAEEIDDFVKNELMKNEGGFKYEETDEDIALNLVAQAYKEKDNFDAVELIDDALSYDKNCIEAYIFLSGIQSHPFLTKHFLKIAVKIGKKLFSKEFLKENKEHLWAMHEVRPFLKAMFGLAEANYYLDQTDKARKTLEYLLEICPDDNVGARDFLMKILLEEGEIEAYKKIQDRFDEDCMATMQYNKVFYSFFIDEDLEKTRYLLEAAKKTNKYVVKKLLNPKLKVQVSNRITLGSIEEADSYCAFYRDLWQDNEELIHWLKQNQ